MKYAVLIGDGMAGRPIKALGNRTCLQKAHTPNMDRLAREGQVGWAQTIPPGYEPGSDVANLAILGYNPSQYYSGRAPIEAAYQGIRLGPKDVAYRCNVVNMAFGNDAGIDNSRMVDYSAGHITTSESRKLITFVNDRLGSKEIRFYPGVSYRHLMVWKNGREKIKCTPPHDITGRKIKGYLPVGTGSSVLYALMSRSHEILTGHSVNMARAEKGLATANCIWLWGQGRKLVIPKFKNKYGLRGALISAVDLTKGLGVCAGFDVLNIKGATGYIDTNYKGKAEAALRSLKKCDFVYVHVEAPDEAGHNGSINDKIRAIQDFDLKVVGPVLEGLKKFGDYRVLVMPDHFTPISVRTHTSDPVPFAIYSSNRQAEQKSGAKSYSENICKMKTAMKFVKGHKLMDYFLQKK
ncbi:MAG: cofactor-independent phosphoglycerate mutase [Nitrospiraceae bacterium]|nr:MAG: cofactor-independent phosphoglycerate mutase [Nitrospiraceae bacterium]